MLAVKLQQKRLRESSNWYRTHKCRYWWWCKSRVSG